MAACAKTPDFDRAPVDATLRSFVDDGRAVGVSALVYKDSEEVYFGAVGMRDREANLPMARDTIVQIQSMTKPITGAALMRLYDRGKFDLDDPLAAYAPEFSDLDVWEGFDDSGAMILAEPKRAPTIRDLGRHTAGFYTRGYPSPLQPLVKSVNPINPENTLSAFAAKLASLPLLFHPGDRLVYAYGTDVEAFLAEQISGQPYADYLRESVLAPLGMNDTSYFVPEEKRARMAAAYARGDDGALERIPDERAFATLYRRMPLTPGGHGLASTLDDYMRFARMIANRGEFDGVRILRAITVEMMGTDQLPATVTDRSWPSSDGAYGWGIDFAVRTAPPGSAANIFGVPGEMYWEGGLGTLFWIDPENDLIAIFFVQQDDYDALHKDFRDAVYAAIGIRFAPAGASP